jgi:hypothetical protein
VVVTLPTSEIQVEDTQSRLSEPPKPAQRNHPNAKQLASTQAREISSWVCNTVKVTYTVYLAPLSVGRRKCRGIPMRVEHMFLFSCAFTSNTFGVYQIDKPKRYVRILSFFFGAESADGPFFFSEVVAGQ